MISSIVLAGGISTRMGQPKALLPWGDGTLIQYHVEQLREAGADEVIVVLGFRGDEIYRRMKGLDCRVMHNAVYHKGRAGSLRIGAKATSRDADAILITNVDQPRPAEFLRKLMAAHDQKYAVTRPAHDGHSGHPVVVSGRLRPELLEVAEETGGLRAVVRAHAAEIQQFEADDRCLIDVNTPDEYQAALVRLGIPN